MSKKLTSLLFPSDVHDNSKLRMYYTYNLRPNDAGVLTLGYTVEPFMVIPPKRLWSVTGHCTADCTKAVSMTVLLMPIGIVN